jgi:transcriptional regulator with XRE-family HTH domain
VTLGKRLEELLRDRKPHLTQEALADRVGVTPSAVGGWLRGTIPYARTLNKLCLVLGVRRDWLLHGEGEKYLPEGFRVAEEMPTGYSRREKITFIEEQAPELLPLVDAFLDSVQKKLAAAPGGKRAKKTRRSSR